MNRLFVAFCALLSLAAELSGADQRWNVLFFFVDDLRPLLGCYGEPLIRTPNIDRLAAGGFVFERAYCQIATCGPSRHSLLTSRRPDTLRLYAWDDIDFRAAVPDAVTLPQHFRNHGYHTQGLGKVFHGVTGLMTRGRIADSDPVSWSVPKWMPSKPRWGPEGEALHRRIRDDPNIPTLNEQGSKRGVLGYEAPDLPDGDLSDGETADKAITVLREIAARPFFLAVGFNNPHLPFVAPKKYWDLYDRNTIPAPANPDPPRGAPEFALTKGGDLRIYRDIPPTGPVPDEQARALRHGYDAAVSYMDACVGRVLDELDRLDLRRRTIVVLWGDQGWQLGEHGQWSKHTNYEAATRVPLIVSVPGGRPGRSERLVESLDVYPTLAELCGLERDLDRRLEGTSFVPLLRDPRRPWKAAAFSQFPRTIPAVGRCMGYAMRTERYRLVEWAVPEKKFRVHELYD